MEDMFCIIPVMALFIYWLPLVLRRSEPEPIPLLITSNPGRFKRSNRLNFSRLKKNPGKNLKNAA